VTSYLQNVISLQKIFSYITVNSSNFAIEADFSQLFKKDGKWHLVAFFSKVSVLLEQLSKVYKVHRVYNLTREYP